jgi:hypothetical protein
VYACVYSSRGARGVCKRRLPERGREIEHALDDGYEVVLVPSDGRERLITAKTLAAAS